MSTLTLFSGPDLLPTRPAAQRHSATSQEAAEALRPKLARKQRQVLELFEQLPDGQGYTDNTLTAYTVRCWDWSVHTARPRRIELTKAGLVEDTGRRLNGSTVWRITAAGLAWLAGEEA